jgi:hypothetical protein
MARAVWRRDGPLAAGVVFLALTGLSCSSQLKPGVITGVVALCPGGITAIVPAGLTRLVTVSRSGHIIRRAVVSAPFGFRFSVPPGGYVLRAIGDQPVVIRVEDGQTVRARLKTICHAVG